MYLCVDVSMYLYICISIYPSIYVSVHLCIYIRIYPSIYLPIYCVYLYTIYIDYTICLISILHPSILMSSINGLLWMWERISNIKSQYQRPLAQEPHMFSYIHTCVLFSLLEFVYVCNVCWRWLRSLSQWHRDHNVNLMPKFNCTIEKWLTRAISTPYRHEIMLL